MLKIIALSASARPVCTKINENELGTNSSGSINGGRHNDKIVNLPNYIKKMSSEAGFLIPRASLTFT